MAHQVVLNLTRRWPVYDELIILISVPLSRNFAGQGSLRGNSLHLLKDRQFIRILFCREKLSSLSNYFSGFSRLKSLSNRFQ
jgi:hypothetical protein